MKQQTQVSEERRRDIWRRRRSGHGALRRRRRARSRAAYRRMSDVATDAARALYAMTTTDSACPACRHPSTEVLEFPDGLIIYCSQCGYRGLNGGALRRFSWEKHP